MRVTRSIPPAASGLLLAFASTYVLAQATPAAAPTAPAMAAPAVAKPNPEDKIICKYQTPIGSRLGGTKVCQKKSDWDAQSLNARQQRETAGPAGIAGSH